MLRHFAEVRSNFRFAKFFFEILYTQTFTNNIYHQHSLRAITRTELDPDNPQAIISCHQETELEMDKLKLLYLLLSVATFANGQGRYENAIYKENTCEVSGCTGCTATGETSECCKNLETCDKLVTMFCDNPNTTFVKNWVMERFAHGVSCKSWKDKTSCKKNYRGEYCKQAYCLDKNACKEGETCLLMNMDVTQTYAKDFTCSCTEPTLNLEETHCNKARSTGYGEPHLKTLDGLAYDIGRYPQSPCQYYLAKADDFIIRLGTRSQGCPLLACVDGIIIDYKGQTIQITKKKDASIVRNDNWHSLKLPYEKKGIHCFAAEHVHCCQLDNGVTVVYERNWGYYGRYDLFVPESYYGHVKGLVGNFNGVDDSQELLMPNGLVAPSEEEFGESWEVPIPGTCQHDRGRRQLSKRTVAEVLCKITFSSAFEGCHKKKLKEVFYANCVFDMQFCKGDKKACLCSYLENLVESCEEESQNVENWLSKVPICKKPCSSGLEYNACSNPCTYSCANIMSNTIAPCTAPCVPNCICPKGQAMNYNGVCIPVRECT